MLQPEPRLQSEEFPGSALYPRLGTGLQIWRGLLDEEYLTDLKPWSRAYRIFREMGDSAVIGGLLEAIYTPLLSAPFTIHPAGKSDQQKRDAEWLEATTLDGFPDMEWREHVEEALDFIRYGFSVSEKVAYKAPDGTLKLRALIPIGQDTLLRWGDPDEYGKVTSFVQRGLIGNRWQTAEAPMYKLLHFTWRPRKRNPMGSPLLRGLYRPWYFVKNLEAIEAIGAERDAGGTPVVTLGEGFYTDAQIAAIEAALKGLRADENSYVILPNGMTLEPFRSGTKIYNVRNMIRDYQHLIRQRFFADFLALGSEQVGTQSLAREMTTFFGVALRSVQARMTETWNHQLVPWLFRLNGTDKPQDELPQIAWDNPSHHNLQTLAQTLTTLVGGNLLAPDFHLENMLRNQLSLPLLTEEEWERGQQERQQERERLRLSPGHINRSGDNTGTSNRQPGDSNPHPGPDDDPKKGATQFQGASELNTQHFVEVELSLRSVVDYNLYPLDAEIAGFRSGRRFDYSILAPGVNGEVGFLMVTISGSRAHVNGVSLDPPYGGTDSIRNVVLQFRARHPQVTRVTGYRISGSRTSNPGAVSTFLHTAQELGLEVYRQPSTQFYHQDFLAGLASITSRFSEEYLSYEDAILEASNLLPQVPESYRSMVDDQFKVFLEQLSQLHQEAQESEAN